MITPLTRGDETLKIDSMPQAIVVSVAILTAGGVGALLLLQGWSPEAIAAAVLTVAGIFTGQWAVSRRASVVDAKQDRQLDQLDVIQHQTNGGMRAAIAAGVEQGVARGVAQALNAQRAIQEVPRHE